jgi:hypothetical protein
MTCGQFQRILRESKLFKEARRIVLAATDNKQVPWETTSITGDFYFRSPAPPSLQPPAPAPQPPKVGSVGPAVLPPAETYEVNHNRAGMDYKNFALTALDPRLCQQACQNDDQCRAWTFVNPGIQGGNARCWLKNGVPVSTPGNCCTSGVKPAVSLAPDQSGAEADCFTFVQGNIPWSVSGVTSWSPTNIQSLCQGTTKAAEPGRCFDRITHGGVNWGGGTKWEWPNALNLCKGTSGADATVSCFQAKIASGARWPQAIAQCKSPVAPLISARPNPTN